jgi:mannosyltransferase OCH1-like enzyme
MPEHFKMICANWINLNPGWEYRYVDHIQREELINKHPELLEYYNSLVPFAQADVWRYLVTYENGGVYADMDSVCIKPLDDMLDSIIGDPELIVVSRTVNDGHTNNANFAVKKNSEIMKKVIEKLYEQDREDYKYREWYPWVSFIKTVYDNNNVSYEFTSAAHSGDFKLEFPKNLEIEYSGEKINYFNFLEKNGLKDKYW